MATVGVQHIDRRELYTSLPARVRYLHSFLDFNADDAAALAMGGKYIKALIPTVVNIVYKKLLSYDITARAFTTRSTSYEGPVDPAVTEDSPQIRHRKMFLRGYLIKLCTDSTRMEFWEYMNKVGQMHVGQGRKHPLHVEYIHMGALLGFVQDILIDAILNHPDLKSDQKTAVIRALGKVLWIQNDLFAKWYVKDGEEFQTAETEPEIEGEGILHGKPIIMTASNGTNEDGVADDGTILVVNESAANGENKGKAKKTCPMAHVKSEEGLGGCPFKGFATMQNGEEAH